MRRAGVLVPLATLALTACIPHVDRPAGYDNPPQRPYRSPPRRDDPPRPRDDSPREDMPRVDRPPQDIPGRDTGEVTTLPAPRPAWEARPVSADAKTIPDTTYVVRPGDTLSRVVDRSGASLEAIARANDLESPYSIQAGQRLQIPGGRYHIDDILTGGEPALASNQAPARPIATPRRVLPSNAVVTAPARLASGGFLWPVDGKVVKRFGHGASGERNDGIKIAVPVSTPIHAAADGVVAYVGDGIAALGGLVIIKHGGGWTSVYGHASKLLVQRGQSVKRGQTIALSGDTGFADRPELHFELRKGRTPVDPTSQLPRT
jgi:lipoprotein NlpD